MARGANNSRKPDGKAGMSVTRRYLLLPISHGSISIKFITVFAANVANGSVRYLLRRSAAAADRSFHSLPSSLPAALFPPRSALFSFPSAILRPAPRVYSSFHSATNYIQRAEEERERDISGLYSVLRLISRQMFPLGGSKR